MLNPAPAQQQIFKNYTVNDGLISNVVRRVFQDPKGFLWIATWEGMSKYDGNTFTNYSIANGLSHNVVNDFYESKNSQLFIALNNGSIDIIGDNKINTKAITGTVVNSFTHTKGLPVIASTNAQGLQEFKAGNLVRPQHKIPSITYLDCIWLNDSLFLAVTDSSLKIFNKKFELFAAVKEHYPKYTSSKIYQLLPASVFIRIHHSYIINKNYVDKYIKGDGGEVVMKNGVVLDVARRKKEEFIKASGY